MVNVVSIYETLLDTVSEKYPNELPKDLVSEVEIARMIGRQDVISYIDNELDRLLNSKGVGGSKT